MLFRRRWKEGEPAPRVLVESRWHALFFVLAAAVMGFLFLVVMHLGGATEAEAEKSFRYGLFIVIVCAIFALHLIVSIVFPARVEIDANGFTVRTYWRAKRSYRWRDIHDVFNNNPVKYGYVAWVNKVDTGKRKRGTWDYDDKLPPALWSRSANDMAAILSHWLDDYNARQTKRR